MKSFNRVSTIGTALLGAALAVLGTGCGSSSNNQAAIAPGLTIVSNLLVSSSTQNFCTQYSGETCTFDGGQRVYYSDGSVLLTGMFSYTRSSGGTTDIDQNSVTVIVPPSTVTSYQTLSQFVARGSGDEKLFLSYTRNPEAVQLYYDSNGNGVLDPTDQLLYTATLYPWN